MRNREEKKCKKDQESTIGKIIYGFLLFMPLLAIFITCGYAMFNKNAYQSYADIQNNNYYLEETNEIKEDNYYMYLSNNSDLKQMSLDTIYIKDFQILDNQVYSNLPTNITSFRIYYNPNSNTYSLQLNGDTTYYYLIATANTPSVITTYRQFSFVATQNQTINYDNSISQIVFGEQNALSNVFYYSVDKVEQSNLFNWAQNSVIYTTTNATCNALSINNTFIPLLLSYWLIISVLYFLYDIALMLVWIIHKKIHEMQESI